MFQLSSDITIGNFHFSGVHEVKIKRSIHSYVDTATIKLPAKAQVSKNGKILSQSVITGKQFTDGDPVTIKLGYSGLLIEEFKGFVTSRDLDIPLQVTCEGYSYKLKRNNLSVIAENITIADLLQYATARQDITVICDVDITLVNVELSSLTGAGIIDSILKETDGNLCIFFIAPTVLWCGLVYTPYAKGNDVFNMGQSRYRLGYNVLKDNSLKQRVPQDDPGIWIYTKKKTNGTLLTGQSTDMSGASKRNTQTLNRIADEKTLAALAQEHQYRDNYTGYEGSINAFLQPYCSPGFQAWISDDKYPERNGFYLVEGTEVTFGTSGARRKIDAGPLLMNTATPTTSQ
ncbi:MAG: hypothetical protein P4L41_16360 [Flavipsychrobacter sp.]|nr:hypothetical protein [Flavipsychrobacter sp.]